MDGVAGAGMLVDQDAVGLERPDDHRRRGLYENSLRFYSRALELDRSLIGGWVGQVQMLILLGEYPEAELWSRKALELFKGQSDLMAYLAMMIVRLLEMRRAGSDLLEALRPTCMSAFRWRANVRR